MGSRDIVKYVVAYSGIMKPIIVKLECSPPIATPNKATSYTLNICPSTVQPMLETTCIE